MSGSKKQPHEMTHQEVLEALRAPAPQNDFVWDGLNEDDRPASHQELQSAIASDLKRRGRPTGSDKTQIALRVDNATLAAFRAMGKGWQSQMNEALKEWLKTHSPHSPI